MMKLAALALVACLFPAWARAADQTLAPDGCGESANNTCSTATAPGTLDEGVSTPGGDWCAASGCGSGAVNTAWRMLFPTPTNPPSSTTDAQTFRIYARKCSAGGADPSVRMDLYCNGVLVESGDEQTVTSETGQVFSELVTFTAVSCAANGSDVEVRVVGTASGGTPSGRRSVGVDAVEWQVTWAAAGGKKMLIVGATGV